MKRLSLLFSLLIPMFFSSCAVVEGIFKLGVWTGVLLVVGIIGLIVYIIFKLFNKD